MYFRRLIGDLERCLAVPLLALLFAVEQEVPAFKFGSFSFVPLEFTLPSMLEILLKVKVLLISLLLLDLAIGDWCCGDTASV